METCHLQPSRPSLPPHSSPLRTLTSDLIMTSCWPPLGLRSPLILVFGLVCASGGGETPRHLLFLPSFSRSLYLSILPSLSLPPLFECCDVSLFACACCLLLYLSSWQKDLRSNKKSKRAILFNVEGEYKVLLHGMLSLLDFGSLDVYRNLLLCDLLNMQ